MKGLYGAVDAFVDPGWGGGEVVVEGDEGFVFTALENAVAGEVEGVVEVRGGLDEDDAVAGGEGLGEKFGEVETAEGTAYYDDGFALIVCIG